MVVHILINRKIISLEFIDILVIRIVCGLTSKTSVFGNLTVSVALQRCLNIA